MAENDGGHEFEGDHRTAIVSLSEIRATPSGRRDRHLLVRIQGADLGQVVTLATPIVRVGRQPGCEIWIGDGSISRRHAHLTFEDDGYVVEDQDSANGTFVQGERVGRRRLQDGDVVQFGASAVYRYSITDAENELMLRQLYEASVKDSLTGTYNREHFDTRLASELSYARRHKTELSLLMFDIDHFKKVNDTYGHPAGDAVLIEIVAKVTKILRAEDVFARYGGEEFAIILRATDVKAATQVADRLRLTISSLPVLHESRVLSVTVSVGCASIACIGDHNAEALIACADRRLYAAKNGGRNRVVSSD